MDNIYLFLRQTHDRYFFTKDKNDIRCSSSILLGEVFNPESAFQLLIKDDPAYEDYDIETMDELRHEIYFRFAKSLKN